MDTLSDEFGFTEVWPPVVVNEDSARGTGQIPDKEDQMYVVTRDNLYLVPTAEVPVTNLHRDEILEAAELPIRYCAYTPCFRREAGAAGKDTRGILRVHQFDKVEMVLFEKPDASVGGARMDDRRRRVRSCSGSGLAYRVLLMSTKEMGFVQAKKYDLEVWAPGRRALARGQLLLELPRLPGPPHGDPPPTRARARRRSCSTRSTARRSGWPGPSPRSSRPTSGPTATSTSPRCCSRTSGRR